MEHRDLIVDQFTKQAIPFSTAAGIQDREALALIVEAPRVGAGDTVRDVCRGPARVLEEMKRVCRPGGTVAVVDVVASADPVKARAFNRMERLRDPSHVRALTLAEIEALFPGIGLPEPRTTFYRLESELEGLLE